MTTADLLRPNRRIAIPLMALLVAAVSGTAVSVLRLSPTVPLVAIFALAVLVVVLLVLPVVPKALAYHPQVQWWQVAWVLFFLSGLVLRARTTSSASSSPLDAAAFYRVILVAAAGLLLIFAFAPTKRQPLVIGLGPALTSLVFYSIFCLASTIWSINPSWTLYRSAEYFATVALTAALAGTLQSSKDIVALLRLTWILNVLLLSTVLVGVGLFPHRALIPLSGMIGFSIEGVLPVLARNTVGSIAAMVFVVYIGQLLLPVRKSTVQDWAIIAISLLLLILSQSRSPMLGAVVGGVLSSVVARKYTLVCALCCVGAVLLSASASGDIINEFMARGQNTEQLRTLSSRTEFWMVAWDSIQERPLTGYGAYAAGRFVVAKQFSDELSSSHGTLPEVAVGTGLVGTILIVVAVTYTWVQLIRMAIKWRYSRLQQLLLVQTVGVMGILSVRAIFSVTFIWHPQMEFLAIMVFVRFLSQNSRTDMLMAE